MVTSKSKVLKGSDAIVECLIKEGVETLFGYPGGAIMPLYDSLFDYQDDLKHILTRHEQGAIHAAQGYARVSKKVGVCLATSGPGATNLITGLADAYIDSTPLVCITGQVASHLLGTDAFQETDVLGVSTPVTKWNIQITKAAEIPAAISESFYIARSGRPGPVLIDITKDAQFDTLNFKYSVCKSIRSYKPLPNINIERIKEAAELINKAARPMVLFGQGVILGQAKDEFKAFIEKAGIPAAWTILGVSAIPNEHPLNVGMLGMHGNYSTNKLTSECDVLIAVGMRFDDRVTGKVSTFASQAKVIHLEIDPAEIDKIIKTDVAVLGDCKSSLSLLTDYVKAKEYPNWRNKFSELDQEEYKEVKKAELHPDPESKITMAEVIDCISNKTKGEAIIVTDVGQHQMIAHRYYNYKAWNSNVTSGGLGTMGFALPAAIGAKLGQPQKQVIAIIGDGGFQMTLQELGTIFQYNIPVKIVVLNNEFLGMVRQWQQLFFDKRYASTEMVNPDFQTIVKGYHIETELVDARESLQATVDRFVDSKESRFLEVRVGKEDNVFPMVPTGSSVSDIRLK